MIRTSTPLGSALGLLALLGACGGDSNATQPLGTPSAGAAAPAPTAPTPSAAAGASATPPSATPTTAAPTPATTAGSAAPSVPPASAPKAGTGATPTTMTPPTMVTPPDAMKPAETPTDPQPQEPAASCTGKTLAVGDTTERLMHATGARTYLLHVPQSYDNAKPMPLVIDMHGYTSNMMQQKMISGWAAKSDAEGFIIAWPQGLNDSWNGGDLCCGSSQATKVDDQGFILELVKTIKERACIDEKRVYATGLSNGGAMSHMMGCNAADIFAAIAPVSMSNGTTPCKPARALPVTLFRATADTLVGYNGGGLLPFESAEDDFEQWRMLNGCTDTPATEGACQKSTQCKDGVEVTLCTVETSATQRLGGHALYSSATEQDIPVADLVWEVFKRYTLP